MIFCITLFQRAASRVKKRQSGAEDPRLRAACVNRVLCPLVARCRPAHVIGQHGQCTMRGRVAVLTQQAKWYRGVIAPALAGGSRSLRLRSVAGKPGHVLRTKVFYTPGKRFAGRQPIVPNLLRSEKRKEVEIYEYAGHRIDRSGVPVWRLCALRPLAG